MFTFMDKAWVAGLVSYIGHILATKLSLGWLITPELIALVAGAATFWTPNRDAPVELEHGVTLVPAPPPSASDMAKK